MADNTASILGQSLIETQLEANDNKFGNGSTADRQIIGVAPSFQCQCIDWYAVGDAASALNLLFVIYNIGKENIAGERTLSLGCGQHGMLGVHKRPDFVTLNPLAGQVAKRLVLILGTGFPGVHQQLGDGVDGNIRQPGSGAKAVAFHNAMEDLHPFINGQDVHKSIMLARASNVNIKLADAFLWPML